MSRSIANFIDHTLLSPTAKDSDIHKLCQEARDYGFRAVCVAGSRLGLARELLSGSDVLLAGVVGFPHGNARELKQLRESASEKTLKLILETCYLEDDDKRNICRMALEAGWDFVKTSTGFGPAGATLADVRLMKDTVGNAMGIKASGGIRDFETARKYLEAGATRIGASSGPAILEGEKQSRS